MSGSSKKSNIALLTEGAAYIQRAKKARRDQVEEIKFDDDARREWLTGFSKRKKAKIEEKRSRAKERDHQAHLDGRRKARQELKERAAENVRAVRAAMGLVNDEAGEDSSRSEAGPSKPSVAAVEEAEYSDEDQLATVTIIEDFDPSSSAFLPAQRASSSSPAPETAPKRPVVPDMPASSHKAQSKLRKEKEKERAKEAKHREKEENRRSRSMETKSERRKGREIEGKRRVLKATLAIERDGRRPRGVKAKGKGAGGKGKGGAGKKRK